MAEQRSDNARFWRSPLLPHAELLTADFYAHVFAPHWHDTFSIPVIQSGAQTYRYRRTLCVAGPSCIAAINPGEVHTGRRATERGWSYRAFYPSVEWMQALAADMGERAAATPWLVDGVIEDAEVSARLTRAHCLLERGGDELAAQVALIDAFALLLKRYCRQAPATPQLRPDHARVTLMQARLSGELAEPLSLVELAEAVGLSPFHAARLFSRSVGMPPHAWRNQLRLNRAQGLLRQGVPVTHVASAVGYTDQSHFTRHFKRAFGAAPGRWQLERR
jgi:AraC-like DNA-binding protein